MYVALNKYRFLYVNPPNVMDTIDFIIPFIFAHNKLKNTTQNMIAFDDFDRSTEECVCVCVGLNSTSIFFIGQLIIDIEQISIEILFLFSYFEIFNCCFHLEILCIRQPFQYCCYSIL